MSISRERATILGVWGAAALACVLGIAAPPSVASHADRWTELLDLVRVGTTTALVITLLLGPGIFVRALGKKQIGLAFLPLPGLALLIATGGLVWVLANVVDPRVVCLAVFGPLLGLLLGGIIRSGPDDLLEPEEQRVLLIVALALGVAIGRSLWSLGPAGELYGGTISRTLVPEGRPDSRISYHVAQLVANGSDPYSPSANALFYPYNFSSRGPFPGMGIAPIILLSGSRPPLAMPEMPWQPFDAQGFMAYRLAMITFSCTVFLSLWELVRRLGGAQAAKFALLLAVTTPFVFSDLWFTWPKLLAASFVLLGGLFIVERRPFRSGLMTGIGYLMHPSALIGLSGIGLLALWPLKGANWRRPYVSAALLLAGGVAISVVAWRLLNGSHFLQEPFTEYITQAWPNYHPTLIEWIRFRIGSAGNTLVPFFLPVFYSDNPSINAVGILSPRAVHFFFQPWTGAPFGFGILFFPLLLGSLLRAGRRWPWPVLATVVLPFVAFTIYWGASVTGILREGMQTWVFVVLAVIALQQAHAGFPWLRSRAIRAILALRALEVMAVALGATLGTNHFQLLSDAFTLNDAVAVATIVACSLGLLTVVWRDTSARDLGKQR